MTRMTGATLTRVLTLALLIPAVACNRKKDLGGYIDSAASTSDTTPAVRMPIKVTDLSVGKGVNADKSIRDQTDQFNVNDTIYVSVKTEGLTSGSKLTATWTYQTGQAVSQSSLAIPPGAPDARREFHLQRASVWPIGKYDVEIMLDSTSAGKKDFSIK